MSAQSVFDEISNLGLKEKKIASFLNKCIKKMSLKSPPDLSNLDALAKWLYIYGHTQPALKVTKIVDDLEFNGNFSQWTPVESLLLLQARIHRERGEDDLRQRSIDKVLEPMAPHESAFKRRLSFAWLSDKGVESRLADSKAKVSIGALYSDLGKLIFIRELGENQTDINGETVDIERAERRILEHIDILKKTK